MDAPREMSSVLTVDGDGHVIEPPDLWTARMDSDRWGNWIPHRSGGGDTLYVGGVARGRGKEAVGEMARLTGQPIEALQSQFDATQSSLGRQGGFDPDTRIADMDSDGIDAAVLYATSALFFGPLDPIEALRDVEFVAACQRAYNDWLSEYCRAHPDRLFGMAAVPLQDVGLAVREAERAVGQLGLKGVFIRPSAYVGELPLNHHTYDAFWAACQDLDVPVSLHPAVHTDTAGACRKFGLVREHPNLSVTNGAVDDEHGGSALGQAVGNTVDMIVSMGRLLMGGVCERFPRLRLIFLESGGGWCATQLERMDEQVEAYSVERHALSLLPSEYFRRQCYISFDPSEWNLAASALHIGPERILWASDYPHPEYRSGIVAELMDSVASLPEADQRRIAGENAVAAYGLPVPVAG